MGRKAWRTWRPGLRDVALVLCVGASLGFSFGIQRAIGDYDPQGLRMLLAAWAASLLAAAFIGRGRSGSRPWVGGSALFGAALELWALARKEPALYLRPTPSHGWFDAVLLADLVALLLVAFGLWRDRPWIARTRRALLVTAFLVGAYWVLLASPAPAIDVWHLNQEASHRLLHGEDPYTLQVPHVDRDHDAMHAPWIDDHYPYPPIVVLLQAPAYLLTGDTRTIHPLAVLAGVASTWFLARRSGLGPASADALAALALLSPRVFFVLEQAWTEPLTIGLLGLALVAHTLGRWWPTTVLFALALSSKQFFVLGFPILALTAWYGWRRALVSAALAASLALPFLLWNAERFVWGTVLKHLEYAPRPDSNSVTAYLLRHGVERPPTWIGPLLWLTLGLGIAAWRRRDPAAPWVALAAGLGALFLFGGQGFANYYWSLALLLAMAAALVRTPTVAGATATD